MDEQRRHISLMERIFGEMNSKQRTHMQRKLGWAFVWVLVCLGIALIVTDAMMGTLWSWMSSLVGLF